MSQINLISAPSGGPIGNVTGPGSSTDGGVATFNGTDGQTLQSTNMVIVEGTGSTSGAVTDDLITLDLGGSATAYRLQVMVIGFESTSPASVGYTIDCAVRTTGAAAVLADTPDRNIGEEAALVGADADVIVNGNNAIVRVTGVAALDISWRALMWYIKV